MERREGMNINRREGEPLLDYQIRLYSNKVAYNLSNEDIGKILNEETGQNIDESAYRKPIQNILKYADRMKSVWFDEGFKSATESEGDTDGILRLYAEKEKELYKREQIVRDQLTEMRRHLRVEGRADNLKQVILDYVDEVEDIRPIKPISVQDMYRLSQEERQRVAVLTLSDWHFGEQVKNFLGEYNKDIFDYMIDEITHQTIEYCTAFKVKTLKVTNMGDLMSGMIHVSTRIANEEDVVEQTIYVAEKLASMLEMFSHHIPEVELYSTVDNHGRVNLKYTDHIEKESFARFIPAIVEPRVKGLPNVRVVNNIINGVEEYDIGIMEIFDREAIFVHGHNDKLSQNALKDLILISQVHQPLCVFMGHYHKNYEDEIHGIDIIVNPAMVPTGEYAKKIRKSSLSRQKLTIFNKDKHDNVFREGTVFITL